MSYQPGPSLPADPVAQRGYLTAQREYLAGRIAQRQSSIAGAEAEIGRIVSTDIRAGRLAPATPEIDGELRRIVSCEFAIGELYQQAYAIDAEAAAVASADRAGDPANRCPACRLGVAPNQRYCAVDGTKLDRPVDAPMPVGPNDPMYPLPVVAPECARCGRAVDPGAAYCTRCGWRVGRSQVSWYRARWVRYGLLGLLLYIFCQAMLPHTHEAGALIIAELIIGAALVPIVFVSYFYERGTRDQIAPGVLVTTFVAGAILGCTTAVILETAVKVNGNWGDIGVGFIEEACKGVILFAWLRRRDLRDPDRGLVIGAATGMGFAALETMQYGLQAFLVNLFNGNGDIAHAVTAMTAELNVRGVLAPLGHGTWTGILAAVIWYERSAGRSVLGARVLLAYVGVSLLHGLYDIAAGSHVALVSFVSGARVSIFVMVLGLLGFVTLLAITRAARRGRDPVAAFFDSAGRLSRGTQAASGSGPGAAGPQQWRPGP